MDPPPSKHKRSISGFLSEKFNKVLRRSPSPGPSTSQNLSRAESIRSPSPSSSPIDRLNLSPRTGSTVALTHQVVAAPRASVSLPLPALTASLSNPEGLPPAIVVSHEAVDTSVANRNQITPTTPIGPDSHMDQRATSGVWAGLKVALRVLHENSGLLPPLRSAIGVFTDCIDALEDDAKNRREYEDLATELTGLAKLLAQHMEHSSTARMSDSIANIARSIEEQANLIKNKQARGLARRIIEAKVDLEDLEQHYRRIGALFRQLQADANLSIWKVVNDQMANTRLEGLMPVKLANYDSQLSEGISRRTCTANTRTAILSGLNDWSNNPEAPDVYWMNGMAGTGKTTIACSFSESLEEHKQLAASFFCTHTAPECREATRIIPTIAFQLARYSIPFQSALCESLGRDPDVGAKNMTKQFERLVKAPLLKVKDAIPNNLVVVIDALDECSDMREVELLLSILLKSAAQLPLKFFVTSRPEPEIYKRMLDRGRGAGDVLHLHEVEKSLVQADIEVYLSEELEFMSPTPKQVQELAERSGNLFIYAATLVRYIRPGRGFVDPHKRLRSALAMTSQSNKLNAEIDELYTSVLEAVLGAEGLEDEEVDDMRNVLWTVVCVQEPVGINTLAAMAGLDDAERVTTVLDALRSVIHFSESGGLVSTLHASFPDFMFDETRSKSLRCNLAKHSELLAQRCFEVMKAQLRFNICKLESSFVCDHEVDDLEERVNQAISPSLWYACRYWGDHLRHSIYSDLLCSLLSDFLSVRVLFWMEVLNLKREIHMGAGVILKARLWLPIDAKQADVIKLAEDSRNFVTSFAANPVSHSTPHIYISSLPFCPRSSSVFQRYWKNVQGLINASGVAMQRRETAPLATWNIQSRVESATYSPNGRYVAVGCSDGTVSVHSAYDGTLVAGPLQGHTDSIMSVGFSPDGSRIASGSWDNTIRVWDAHNNELVAGPFQGHNGIVMSVGYSPDGSRIVSGSWDDTIRVWSAQDGTLLAGPFLGHDDSVWSVVYSPDGSRIVSGSADKTIRVWDAHTSEPVSGPLQGHSGAVRSVAYSPDGSRIVSGSEDMTIRIWNPHDGALVAGPLQGHTGFVRAVGYSSDGSRIVSGSDDRTIRVWSVYDGILVAGPFWGHANSVVTVGYSPDNSSILSGSLDKTLRVWGTQKDQSLATSFQGQGEVPSVGYSPDGSRIVSGSWDNTVRVWSAHNGKLLTSPFQGHTSSVLSVAYSPDGLHIVSGSADKTIQVWDAYTGELAAGPLQGHAHAVWSVAYSPNGSRIVSGSVDTTIRVWDAHTGELVTGPLLGHSETVRSVAYSPDGLRIASGSDDMTIRIWNPHDSALVAGPLQGHTNFVRAVRYSSDGSRIVSGSNDRTIRVWDAHVGTLVFGPLQGHTGSVLSVGYSPDGSCIFSGSTDKTIRVWSAYDGSAIAGPLQGHTGFVLSVAYSPDGTCIASGSTDETIRVWSAHEGTRITRPFIGHGSLITLATSSPSSPHADLSFSYPTTTQAPNTSHDHQSKLDSALGDWAVRPDGWVVNNHSQLLFWVPFELAGYLPTARELLVIYHPDQFRIDSDDELFLGDQWHQCYRPE